MWDDLVRHLGGFPDGVLTWVDGDGCPASVRCLPRADHDRRVLSLGRVPGATPSAGPASLLCHSHDDRLGRLRSFLVRGQLGPDGPDWVLTPGALVPGPGVAGPLADLRTFLAARRRAGRYLARRQLARPAVPWQRLR